MYRGIAIRRLTAFFMSVIICALFIPFGVNAVLFTDVQGHWAENEINKLAAQGIVRGRGNMTFDPEAHVTRSEFYALLVRAFTLTGASDGTNSFVDVKEEDWFYSDFLEAQAYGFISPEMVSDSHCFPVNPILREEMAYAAIYAWDNANTDKTTSAFSDFATISPWAKKAVIVCTDLGFILGLPDGTFDPDGVTSRAQATVIICRMLDALGIDVTKAKVRAFGIETLRLVNIEREKAGVKPLKMGVAEVWDAGSIRAKELQRRFSHIRPTYDSFTTALDDADVLYTKAAENIARSQNTPDEAVKWLMLSTIHRTNLLNPEFDVMGFGLSVDDVWRLYWEQILLTTKKSES